MVRARKIRRWDVDRRSATPESTYRSRRQFLKLAGVGGVGAISWSLLSSTRDEGLDEMLRATVAPLPDSPFLPGRRNAKYVLDRRVTDELQAARYNNFYEFGLDKSVCWKEAQKLTVRPWTIEVGGLVDKPRTFDVDDLIRKMPREERLYRFRCVERWSMAVPWSGFPLAALIKSVEPLSNAKYVRFVSFNRPEEAVGQKPDSGWSWPYYEALRMDEAVNEMAFVATGLYGHDIPKQHGAPFRMVVPWKYGYKGAKSIVKIEFVDRRPRTFWNDQQPTEYGFFSNVNPEKPHPRWSQRVERMIGTNEERKTLPYNGYGEFVAEMYTGKEH